MKMDDIKISIYQEKIETLIQTIRIFCLGIGMDFGIRRRTMLLMKKREMKEENFWFLLQFFVAENSLERKIGYQVHLTV